jgi:hypothetical protein
MRLTFEFTSENQPEQILDAVTEALFDLESSSPTLHDADVSASLEKRKISLAIVGIGETIDDASANASSAIRTAIHTSGGSTPGWDETVEVARSQAVFKFLEQTSVPA